MQLEADPIVAHPRARVFVAYRDHLPELTRFLPEVHSVRVVSRREEGHVVKLVNEWRAHGPIPEPVARLLGDSLLRWHDEARWDEERWLCTWHIRSEAFPEAIRCEGENRFVALSGERTRVQIVGELDIDLRRMAALPKALAAPLAQRIEHYIVRQVTQNFLGVAEAVDRFLGASGERTPSEEAPTDPGAAPLPGPE